MHIVITGNPVDGLTHFGPFETWDEAREWAEREYDDMDWWIGELSDPAEG